MTAKVIVRWYGKIFNSSISNRLQSGEGSRLHKNHLLISFAGRKSGKQYTIPVNYCITPEGTYAVSTEGNWRHNFSNGSDVQLLVGGESIAGHGVQITDDPEKRTRLGRMLTGVLWLLFSRSLTVIEITPRDAGQTP